LSPTPLTTSVGQARVSGISMAHHVKDKAAKKHNSCRPRKSRLSDINRAPTNYPQLPERTGPITGPPQGMSKQTVTITVAPGDNADAVKAKLTAAGATAPTTLVFRGTTITGTLGDAGLAAEESINVVVYA